MIDAVFAKTPKGSDELVVKTGNLTPRMRWVLILIDGKRPVSELRNMMPADDLQHTLGMLEEDGYIVLVDATHPAPALAAKGTLSKITKAAAPTAGSASANDILAFTPLPTTVDPTRLLQSRNFMANTLKTFIGMVGISSLLERIEKAQNHADLRALFHEWYHTIVMSRDGRREAEALRAKLLQII